MVSRVGFLFIAATVGLISVVHGVQGLLLLIDPSAGFITSLDLWVNDLKWGRWVTGIVLLGAASLATIGAWVDYTMRPSRWGIGLAIPQQFLLFGTMIGALLAMQASTFADGVVRPRAFIAADQIPYAAMFIFHGFALWAWTFITPMLFEYRQRSGHAD